MPAYWTFAADDTEVRLDFATPGRLLLTVAGNGREVEVGALIDALAGETSLSLSGMAIRPADDEGGIAIEVAGARAVLDGNEVDLLQEWLTDLTGPDWEGEV